MNTKQDMHHSKLNTVGKRPIISCSIELKAYNLLNNHCKRILVKRSALVNKLIIDYLQNVGEWKNAI